MEKKYSREMFDGYTHRFILEFVTNEPYSSNITIYSNSGSFDDMTDFANEKKSDKVHSFRIVQRATKEQDEIASKFIDEVLANI